MGVRITKDEGKVALFDSVSGFAFGPVFDDEFEAEAFLAYCRNHDLPDPRAMSDRDIEDHVVAFRRDVDEMIEDETEVRSS